MNVSELVSKHIAELEARIESLKTEFAKQLSRANAAEQKLAVSEVERRDNQTWLDKIRRAMSDASVVRGDYEASVQALIADHLELKKLKQASQRGTDTVPRAQYQLTRSEVEELQDELEEERAKTARARELLDAQVKLDARIRRFVEGTEGES